MSIMDWLSRIFGTDQAIGKQIEALHAEMLTRFERLDTSAAVTRALILNAHTDVSIAVAGIHRLEAEMKLRFDQLDTRGADLAAGQANIAALVRASARSVISTIVASETIVLGNIHTNVGAVHTDVLTVQKSVDRILGLLGPSEAATLNFEVSLDGGATYFEAEENKVTAKVTDAIRARLVARDVFGNVTTLDPTTPPTWTPTGDLSIVPAADGLTADIAATGPATAGNLAQAVGDADLGPGVKPILGTLTIDWLPGDAVTVEVLGEIVPPAPAPPPAA